MTAQIETREIGNLRLEGIPEIPPQLDEQLNRYHHTREAALIGWLPDGQGMLIATRSAESAQVHRVWQAGSQPEPLTSFEEPVFHASISSDASRPGFAFLKDTGGSEAYQLFYFDLATGQTAQITADRSRNDHIIWDTAGQNILFSSTRRNNRDHDIYRCSLHGQPKLLLKVKGYWYPLACSPDGGFLLLECYHSIVKSHVYILELATGSLTCMVQDPDADIVCRQARWDATGEGIYLVTNECREFASLAHKDLRSGALTVLTSHIPWDIELFALSIDGQRLVFVANENGVSRLYCLDTATQQYELVEDIPLGQIKSAKWHPHGNLLAMTINTPTAPADVFVYDFKKSALQRWTHSSLGGLNPAQFVMPSLVHYPTFDEHTAGHPRLIPAYYYRPRQQKAPHSVLIYIHGGPESQFRPEFLPTFQYYLNELGIAVIAPNVRGSTGYGKSFLLLDNGYKREDSVHDIGALLDWVAQQPELDASKIAVFGGSYGGYMVLAAMTHYNDRLRCGIDVVGISNFVTFLKNTKAYRRDLRRVEYGDERDPHMRHHLERISPTNNAHKITKPVLIVQGQNDPRVPASEAEQMLRAIRRNGSEAWYMLAKDEGHGFRKKSNRDYYNKAVILFLQRYLV